MDINGFNHEEYFGFGGYKQLPNSNTSFLNFGVEETPEYQKALRKHNSLMEDLTTDADKKAETERFKKEVAALKITYGGQQISKGLGKIGQIFSDLGIKPKSTDSTTQITANQNNPPAPKRGRTWIWIVVGIAVIGGAAFAVYKYKK
jgi:hypothetical protein